VSCEPHRELARGDTLAVIDPWEGCMALLEVLSPTGRRIVELEGDRVLVGKSSEADLVIDADDTVSRRHALLQRVGDAWMVSDLDSKNGTKVNRNPLFGDRALRDGDELLLGHTRLVYRAQTTASEASTATIAPAPAITPREKDVLVELCRPVLSGSAFTPPATVREIAEALFVGESDVKGHIGRLYDKFQIDTGGERRVRLANAALQCGAVTFGDLKRRPDA
jgi:hypothetical protein